MEPLKIAGFVLSVLGVFPLAVRGILYMLKKPVILKNMKHVDYSSSVLTPFGIIKIITAALTLIPATSFVGVILATGWMDGAIAAHVRVGDKYVIRVILPILIWRALPSWEAHWRSSRMFLAQMAALGFDGPRLMIIAATTGTTEISCCRK